MYAVLATGGKQYRVSPGDVINVEKLAVEADSAVELTEVLLVSDDDGLRIGTPLVAGAKVTAKVLAHGKGKKIIAFRYKPKKHVRVKRGHRQLFTQIQIESIQIENAQSESIQIEQTV
ncbi:MAG: 50S ribosomal protein L21 [Gracilibacteraceae bacterium]|jgi:large subunit ribosomal protein L21|nr:50S ribosomal protein L21 [Gracilibacteraceae bacterium]